MNPTTLDLGHQPARPGIDGCPGVVAPTSPSGTWREASFGTFGTFGTMTTGAYAGTNGQAFKRPTRHLGEDST